MKIIKHFEKIFKNFKQKIAQKKTVRKYEFALAKTQTEIISNFNKLERKGEKISDSFYLELEELLINSDIDYAYTTKIVEGVKKRINKEDIVFREKSLSIITEQILQTFVKLQKLNPKINLRAENEITCITLCGVNGSGKTTTIVKIARLLEQEYNRKVMLIAADIFRHGAVAQLATLAQRNKLPIFIDNHSNRPGSVVYQGIQMAKKQQKNVVLIDTSGRLHNNNNLILELQKINQVAEKCLGYPVTEKLLVVDATNGQSIKQQLEKFDANVGITGLILTKLDSSSRGGAILAIMDIFQKPTKYIGTGEKITDISSFDLAIFLYQILKFIKI